MYIFEIILGALFIAGAGATLYGAHRHGVDIQPKWWARLRRRHAINR